MTKLNTRLESEGAEFLVLGQLLIHRIAAYKTYTNMPGYDIVAFNPRLNTSARIQVKSRWRTDAEGFLISRFDCDFVAVVLLNRGSKDGKTEIRPPEYYLIPVTVVKKACKKQIMNKVYLNNIRGWAKYRENWNPLRDFLKKANTADKASDGSDKKLAVGRYNLTQIEMINNFIQYQMRKRKLSKVTAIEAAKWLDRARILSDSSTRPGLPLRRLLRDKRIIGQRQKSNSRWLICAK